MEQFANNVSTTVAVGGYTAGSGVLNVASTGSPWPASGTFRVSIFDPTRTTLKAILCVTGVNSSTQFAVTAEADGNANAGDPVLGTMITSGSMAQFKSDMAWVLLEEHTASSSASLAFTSWYSSAYDDYNLEFVNIIPATDGAQISLQFSTNAGSTYDSSAIYDKTEFRWGGGGSGGGANDINLTSISWPESTDGITSSSSYGGLTGSLRLSSPGSSSIYKTLTGYNGYTRTSTLIVVGQTIFARYRNTTAVNAFKIAMTSGNIASGTVRVYGLGK